MIGVDRIPVTILTGFLGSGKTTLLAALIQRLSFSGTAVVMNEFGEIALDHQLMEMGDEDLLTLSIGCTAALPGSAGRDVWAKPSAGERPGGGR